jgi:hypothetical protein
MRADMNDSKLVAEPLQADVARLSDWKKRSTGSRPKYAENQTTTMPPAPNMKTLPAVA